MYVTVVVGEAVVLRVGHTVEEADPLAAAEDDGDTDTVTVIVEEGLVDGETDGVGVAQKRFEAADPAATGATARDR